MNKQLAPDLFVVPKPPPRTPVRTPDAEAFLSAEKSVAIMEDASPLAPAPASSTLDTAAPDVQAATARLSVDIPASTLRALKIAAIERGSTVREFILTLLEREGLTR